MEFDNLSTPQTAQDTRRPLLLGGLAAGLVTAAFMIATRGRRGADAPIDLIGDAVLQVIPVALFTFMLRTFQHTAKSLLLVSVIAGIVIAGALIARMCRRTLRPRPWGGLPWRIVKLAAAFWVPVALVVVLIASYGSAVPMDSPRLLQLALDMALDMLVFSAALHVFAPLAGTLLAAPSTRVDGDVDAPEVDSGRRRLLAAAGGGLLVAVGLGYVGSYIRGVYTGGIAGTRGQIPTPITPVGEFYVISKNFGDPLVETNDWTLELSGLVDNRMTLTYADLLALPSQQQLTTLTCISNQIGGGLISNAEWTGVRLADLLLSAGLRSGGIKLAIYAHDGYTESMPLSKALESTTMLVYLMNGEPLNVFHGAPARLIVPGKYGIKNVKWIRSIEVVAGNFQGYWQQRGWTDDATIQTMSRIDLPGSRTILPFEPVEIGGVAYAGDRGIARVEWSSDGGQTWAEADVIEEVAPLSWVIWRSTWNPTARGSHRLVVRATDGAGEVQPAERRPPIPTGAHGHHSIDVGIA